MAPALDRGRCPAAPVADVGDVVTAEQTEALEILQPLEHPTIPDLRLTALPLSFDGGVLITVVRRRSSASTAEVLTEAGYSDEQIAELAADGVIRTR